MRRGRWYPWGVLSTRHHRRGSYAIMVALLMIVLLGFAALAIDLSYLRLARLQAQNAADAGAHAALTEFRVTRDQEMARRAGSPDREPQPGCGRSRCDRPGCRCDLRRLGLPSHSQS